LSIPVGNDDFEKLIKALETRLVTLERSSQTFGTIGGGQRVIAIPNADVVPVANFANGAILYAEGGVLKYRKADGTIVTIGSGGGGGTPANVPWGPDFGEANGADDVTWRAGVQQLLIDSFAIENTQGVGVNLSGDLTITYNDQVLGVHQSGEVLGAPFWQSVGTKALAVTLGDTSIVCPNPSGLINGELMLAFVVADASAASPDINTPAGWNLVSNIGVGNFNSRCFSRVASGEGANTTFGFTATALRATAEIHRITAPDPTTPVNTSNTGQASVISPVVVAASPTVVNTLVMAFVAHSHAATQAHTAPAGHVERTDFEDSNVTLINSSSYTKVFAGTGTTGTATVTCNELAASQALYHRVAIAPGTLTIAA